ncbi:MAG: hypothetical protein K9M75_03275, partial [Phycisphaerae bacterium]|nr:hypothetical protein [Phycisphaerae bacterium]
GLATERLGGGCDLERLTRAEAADGPRGSEAAGDELMTSEVGHLWPGERSVPMGVNFMGF